MASLLKNIASGLRLPRGARTYESYGELRSGEIRPRSSLGDGL